MKKPLLAILFASVCCAPGQTVTSVSADGNGTLIKPSNFFSANGVPSLAGDNTFAGNNTFTGNVSLSLAESVTFQRVNIGSADYGWRYNPAVGGQVEFVFPGGAAAWYQTGTPPRPYMYFAGTMQADYLVGQVDGSIDVSDVTTTGGSILALDIMMRSMPLFLQNGSTFTMASSVTPAITATVGGLLKFPNAGTTDGQADNYYLQLEQKTINQSSGGGGNVLTAFQNPKWRTGVQFAADTHASASASLDFPSISAGGSASLTVTVSGAVTTNTPTVSLGWSAALPAGIVVSHAWVSAANTVTVTLSNITAAAIDPAAVTCRAALTQY